MTAIINVGDTIRTPNIIHGSASENIVGQITAVGDSVGDYREENYKTYFEIWNEDYKLQSKHKNIETSLLTLD